MLVLILHFVFLSVVHFEELLDLLIYILFSDCCPLEMLFLISIDFFFLLMLPSVSKEIKKTIAFSLLMEEI